MAAGGIFEFAANIHKIEVGVLSGHGLRAADLNGKSDPYAIVYIDQANQAEPSSEALRIGKTKTIKKTLDPVWNDRFIFRSCDVVQAAAQRVEPSSCVLYVRVFDWDRVKDDYLGEVRIPLAELAGAVGTRDVALTVPSEGRYHRKKTKGSISLSISLIGPSDTRQIHLRSVTGAKHSLDVEPGCTLGQLRQQLQRAANSADPFQFVFLTTELFEAIQQFQKSPSKALVLFNLVKKEAATCGIAGDDRSLQSLGIDFGEHLVYYLASQLEA